MTREDMTPADIGKVASEALAEVTVHMNQLTNGIAELTRAENPATAGIAGQCMGTFGLMVMAFTDYVRAMDALCTRATRAMEQIAKEAGQ